MADSAVKVTIDVSDFDTVKEAICRREAKIAALQEFIRDKFCRPCRVLRLSPYESCCQCHIGEQLEWHGEQDD